MALLEAVDPAVIQWAGIGLLHPQNRHPAIMAALPRECPVRTGISGIHAVARGCDVLLVWGIANSHALLPEERTCRVVLVSHGSGPWSVGAMADAAYADVLVAVAQVAAATFPEDQRHRVRILRNGVDPARVKPRRPRAEQRAAWGIRPGQHVLGYLGRLSPEKDPEALVRAIAALPPCWVGVAVGEGELREKLAGSERCLFPGATAHVGDALAGFDRLLLPSHEEACSLTLIEAWLSRLPVVATPVGMVPELPWAVRQVPVGASGAELAAAVSADVADVRGTRERVRFARAYAKEHLTPGPFGRAWTALLRDAAPRWDDLGNPM